MKNETSENKWQKAGMIRLSVDLHRDKHELIKRIAKRSGYSMRVTVLHLIDEMLKREAARAEAQA